MHASPVGLVTPLPAPETAEDALFTLMMAMGRRLRQRQPGDVVDFSAFPILKLLNHQGPMRLSGVAQLLGLDASTVSRHVRHLEDRGLLERTEDPDDGRASRVGVSTAGAACLLASFETRRHLITGALAGFSADERETLRALLARFVDTLTAPEPSSATGADDSPAVTAATRAAPEPVALDAT